METGAFIALINPGMSLIFAAAFLLLWRHRPHQRHVAVLGAAFVALGLGFVLQYFVLYDDVFSRLLSNVLLLGGVAAFFGGSLARFGRTPPMRLIALVTGVGFAFFVWYLYVDHDITMRIYVINFTVGAIMAVMTVEVAKTPNRKLIDNLLLGLLIFWSVTYFMRPIVVIWLDGPYADYAELRGSLYWYTLTFSTSLALLVFPLVQITAIAVDVMDELKRESQTDMLSGLLNRRGFEEQLEKSLGQRRLGSLPISLVVCDLDCFKTVNDTHGHAVGDRLIALFASTLRDSVSAQHVVGRIGGEEFAVLLPGADLAMARLFAEAARTAFSRGRTVDLPPALVHTASFGIAEMTPGDTPASLMARADAALYEAKRMGRDCVRASMPEPVLPQEPRRTLP